MMMVMLRLMDLNTHYGSVHALKGINIRVEKGEIVTLIGSNGAGKTTTLNTLTGILPASAGKIIYKDQDITNLPAHKIASLGISMSPEGREVFANLSVEENLNLGAYMIKDKNRIQASFKRVYDLFPRLKEREKQGAGTLSGGEQQMLAIGRALMSEPDLLILDEPSLGLAPNLVALIFKLIKDINRQGTTIMLVEQNANMALHVANRAYVLETGRIKLYGDAKDLSNDDAVRKAYLGG